jgi:replicative DNA helicase Mcm
MEQQRISVAKAGINATLQSRCSVFAAANPKGGRFDEFRPLADQINLPPSLLSRFDAIFPIIDKPDVVTDGRIAEHILNTHRMGERLAHSQRTTGSSHGLKGKHEAPIERELLRKYIAYARRSIIPIMTDGAMEGLKRFFIELRQQSETNEDIKRVTITARQLEAMVRMTEASAKVRLSTEANETDAERAIKIFQYYMSKVANTDTGGFDIDFISSDTSSSQRGRIKQIQRVVRDLADREGASKSGPAAKDIREALDDKGIAVPRLEEDLRTMTRNGMLYEPVRGHFKPV